MSVEALTYAPPGTRLTASPEAARSLAGRGRKPRSLSTDGNAQVGVRLAEIRHMPPPPRGGEAGDIARLAAKIEALKAEIARLESQIKDIATLRAEIEALKARQKAVEDLQSDRNMPVYLLDELVKQTPEGVYLSAIRQSGQVVTVTGVAQTNERVSEFLRNAQSNSPWLERMDLVEIKAVNQPPAAGSRGLDSHAEAASSKQVTRRVRTCWSRASVITAKTYQTRGMPARHVDA